MTTGYLYDAWIPIQDANKVYKISKKGNVYLINKDTREVLMNIALATTEAGRSLGDFTGMQLYLAKQAYDLKNNPPTPTGPASYSYVTAL